MGLSRRRCKDMEKMKGIEGRKKEGRRKRRQCWEEAKRFSIRPCRVNLPDLKKDPTYMHAMHTMELKQAWSIVDRLAEENHALREELKLNEAYLTRMSSESKSLLAKLKKLIGETKQLKRMLKWSSPIQSHRSLFLLFISKTYLLTRRQRM